MLNLKHSSLLRFLQRVHSYLFFTCLLYSLFSLERPSSARGYLVSFGACQALRLISFCLPLFLVHLPTELIQEDPKGRKREWLNIGGHPGSQIYCNKRTHKCPNSSTKVGKPLQTFSLFVLLKTLPKGHLPKDISLSFSLLACLADSLRLTLTGRRMLEG